MPLEIALDPDMGKDAPVSRLVEILLLGKDGRLRSGKGKGLAEKRGNLLLHARRAGEHDLVKSFLRFHLVLAPPLLLADCESGCPWSRQLPPTTGLVKQYDKLFVTPRYITELVTHQ